VSFDTGWREKQRVLDLLTKRGAAGVSSVELSDPGIGGLDGTRRVRSLRQEGHPVQREKIPGTGYWRYWLGPPTPSAQRGLWEDDDEVAHSDT
jgi:hypothetical protein